MLTVNESNDIYLNLPADGTSMVAPIDKKNTVTEHYCPCFQKILQIQEDDVDSNTCLGHDDEPLNHITFGDHEICGIIIPRYPVEYIFFFFFFFFFFFCGG